MAWTQATYLDTIRAEAEATDSDRWSDAHVARVLSAVHAAEWKQLLDANPDYRSATVSVTTDTSARIAKSSLSTGTANSRQRLYKVRGVYNGTTPYEEGEAADYLTALEGDSGTGVWWESGSYLQLLPGDASTTLTVRINWTPTPAGDLTPDTTEVDWPEDYELVLAWEAAAILLARGGSETEPAADLKALAATMRESLLAQVARVSTRPQGWRYSDAADAWGGC
jgi:hypothetical protein